MLCMFECALEVHLSILSMVLIHGLHRNRSGHVKPQYTTVELLPLSFTRVVVTLHKEHPFNFCIECMLSYPQKWGIIAFYLTMKILQHVLTTN